MYCMQGLQKARYWRWTGHDCMALLMLPCCAGQSRPNEDRPGPYAELCLWEAQWKPEEIFLQHEVLPEKGDYSSCRNWLISQIRANLHCEALETMGTRHCRYTTAVTQFNCHGIIGLAQTTGIFHTEDKYEGSRCQAFCLIWLAKCHVWL